MTDSITIALTKGRILKDDIQGFVKKALSEGVPAAPAAAAAVAPSVEALRFPEMPPFEIPVPSRHVLDNGLVVLLLEDHELPLVEARARIRTGSVWEPADRVGLASITGRDAVMTRSTNSAWLGSTSPFGTYHNACRW